MKLPSAWQWWLVLVVLLAAAPARSFAQQPTPDDQAAQLLDAARRAYNERNQPFAIERFKEFIQKYGGHKDVHHARLGLGLAILESATPDNQLAIDQLRPAADAADFPERPLASFYLATGHRALGHNALVLAAQKPTEAPTHNNTAKAQFEQAVKAFDIAATGFAARLKTPPVATENLPADYEWATRARLDQTEMLLRLAKTAEAQAMVDKLLADPLLAKSKYLPLARYYQGYALHASGKHLEAAKVLAQLAPFDDRAFGVHARYMLGRAHHLLGQRAEASQHYEAILTAYDAEFKLATQVKADPNFMKGDLDQRARLLIVAAAPPPEYVARSWFYAGVLSYEQEKFSEALERFTQFATRYKTSPLANEAILRKGFAQVKLKQNLEATQTLAPIADEPQLGDQARWWLGRAYLGLAGANPQAFAQQIGPALDQLKRAGDRANQLAAADPAAKLRRHDILVELGDAYQQNKQFNEAAASFQQMLNEQPDAERAEVGWQRLAAALHLAGKFKESDDAVAKFVATYPKSSLLPFVQFRSCENALAVAEAAFVNPNTPNKEATLKSMYGEVLTRTDKFLKGFPESPDVNLVRHAAGLSNYRLGQFEQAAALFKAIPLADRSGDLATVPYLQADCVLRLAPETADDAIAAGALLDQAGEVVKLLDGFIAVDPKAPQVPDALVKLGDAHQRIAGVLSSPQEKAATLQLARTAYEKVMQQFAAHPANAIAVYERARCMMTQGDPGGSLNEYKRFEGAPLNASPIAPMAILRYATMLRQQKRAAEAITPITNCRAQHEAALLADPKRAYWAPLLQYHHGLCLREAAKIPEAQAIFENLVQRFPKSPEGADAAWRVQQCKREILLAKLEPARVTLARIDAPPAEKQAAQAVFTDTQTQLNAIVLLLEQHAAALAAAAKGSEAHLGTQYETAWCYRVLAPMEIAAAREKLREDARKKRQEEIVKVTPPGRPVPQAALPDVPLAGIPLTNAETKARALYTAMIQVGGESRLVPVAKLELAEVHSAREEFDAAIKLLEEAISSEPADADLAERLRVRAAACYLAKGDGSSAQAEVDALAKNDKGPLWAEAKFLNGEALALQKKYAEAVEMLKLFRDDGRLHNIPNISDRAMLRLAVAYEQLKQWEPARQVYETLVNRYPNSPWKMEARYGMGWCHQQLQQWDPATNQYGEVIKGTTAEVAARAQYNIGACRQAQQRFKEAADAYQLCAYTYDYPELCAQALLDAATSLEAMKLVPDAAKLLAQVAKEYPSSKVAAAAAERLKKLSMVP